MLVISAVALLVVGIFGSLGLGVVVLTTLLRTFCRPSAGATFEAPEVSPVELADRRKRLSAARRQFESKMEDANEQIRITNFDASGTDREIRGRYRELFENPEKQR